MEKIPLYIKNYLKSFTGLPQESWPGILLCFFESFVGGVCSFLTLYFVNTLHVRVPVVGLMLSAYGIGRILGGVLAGRVIDLVSIKFILIFSLFLEGICFILLSYNTNVHILIIDLFFLGLAIYGFLTANNLWVVELCGNSEVERLKSINLLYTCSNLGLGLAVLFFGVMAWVGFQCIFFFSGFLFLVISIWLLFFNKLNFHTKNIIITDTNCQVENKEKKTNIILFLAFACLFFASLVVVQQNVTFLVYLQERFHIISYKEISYLVALNPILIILFQTPLVTYLGKYNKVLLMGIGILFMGSAFLFLNISDNIGCAIVACIIYTFGEMIFFTIVQFVIYENTSAHRKGTGFGLYRTVYAFGAVVGPALGANIYHHFGGDILWNISASVSILLFAACIYYSQQYTLNRSKI